MTGTVMAASVFMANTHAHKTRPGYKSGREARGCFVKFDGLAGTGRKGISARKNGGPKAAIPQNPFR
jgi:hypothetical protein